MIRLKQFSIMILVASALHLVWALSVVMEPDVSRITALHLLASLTPSHWIIAAGLITVSVMAVVANLIPNIHRITRVILLLPQQVILIVSSIGVASVMATGVLPDGTPRPFWTLAASLSPIILITCGYILSISRIVFHQESNTHG